MKRTIFILFSFLISFIILFCYSCSEKPADPELPFTYDVAVLLNTKVYKYSSHEINYYLDIAIIKGAYSADSISELKELPDSNFIFYDFNFSNGSLLRHWVTRVEYLDTIGFQTYYHALMIDQSNISNSYEKRDPYNYRFENINAYLKNINAQGNVILSAYSRNGKIEQDTLTIYGNNFTMKWNKEISTNLLDLTHKTAGTSSQYDALYNMIEFMSKNSPDSNRSISIYIINKDDGNSIHSLDEIIDLAVVNHVKINPVFLSYSSDYVDFRSLLQLANETGGYVELGGIWQLSSSFFMLNRILKRQVHFYRIYVTQTITPPNWFGDEDYFNYLTVRYDTIPEHDNSVYFLLQKP